MEITDRPGFYELIGDEYGAAEVFAALLASTVKGALWIYTLARADDALAAMLALPILHDADLELLNTDHLSLAFQAIYTFSPERPLIILDDLATLRPDHPGARRIAASLRRAIVRGAPSCPVLVLNQKRVPAPPGGEMWRLQTESRELHTLHYGERALVAMLNEGEDARCLIWIRDRMPEFRKLEGAEKVKFARAHFDAGSERSWIV